MNLSSAFLPTLARSWFVPRKIARSLPPVALLITTVIWGGCSNAMFSPLEDLCAGHTVLEPKLAVVTYSTHDAPWHATDREIWAMERKLQHYFSKPNMELGNANYTGIPPPEPSGMGIADYYVSYEAYPENGRKLIAATGYLQSEEHAKAWFENETRTHQPNPEDSDEETVIPLLPFGGGTTIFHALYDAESRKLLKFRYGAPL